MPIADAGASSTSTKAGEAAYMRLFEELSARGVRGLKVTQSAKLSAGQMEASRYFVRFAPSRYAAEDVMECCRHLGFPQQAEAWVQTQLGGSSGLDAVGAAQIHGEMYYRAYFRTGLEIPGTIYCWAIEWNAAGSRSHGKRSYRMLDLHTVAQMQEPLSHVLRLTDARETEIYQAWMDILQRGGDYCQLLEVSETNSSRLSFDASPAFVAPMKVSDIQDIWQRWCRAFGIETESHREWWERAASSKIENTTIGRDGRGALFASIYFGPYDRPLVPARSTGATKIPVSLQSVLHTPIAGEGVPIFVLGKVGAVPNNPMAVRSLEAGDDPMRSAKMLAEPEGLQAMLEARPEAGSEFAWTVDIHDAPAYLVAMDSAHPEFTQNTMKEFLRDANAPEPQKRADISAIAGRIAGWSRLPDGRSVPVLRPNPRSMFCWSVTALLETLPQPVPDGLDDFMRSLLARAGNPGVSAQDRVMNFMATQPSAFVEAFARASERGLRFADIEVTPNHLQALGYSRWDVRLMFSPPLSRSHLARLTAEFTVDASEEIPIFVGTMRSWEVV